MFIQQLLPNIDELHSFSNHSTFAQNIPVEWIESALTLSSKATIRRRRLPFSSASKTVKQSAYPLLPCVALMNTHSHIILDAQIGNYRKAETPLANVMFDKIPDRRITLLGRNFWSANLMHALMNGGR